LVAVDDPCHRPARRTVAGYLTLLITAALGLGVLHYFFADLEAHRVYWLNLDKERNLPTWFSAALFFLLGLAAAVAYVWERKRNLEGEVCFRLPVLWLGVSMAGLLMSVDEMTILHENLFWREVRQSSARSGGAWLYVTQWQIVFAPVILLLLGYFALFFSNRFSASRVALRSAFAGIGSWMAALLLEGVRAFSKQGGWYSIQVLLEEELEMLGAILLLGAVCFYVRDIATDFTPERRRRLRFAASFLTRNAVLSLALVLFGLAVSGGVVYVAARKQAHESAPVPKLFEKALGSRQGDGVERPSDGGPAR
jgi:hypothetical protein